MICIGLPATTFMGLLVFGVAAYASASSATAAEKCNSDFCATTTDIYPNPKGGRTIQVRLKTKPHVGTKNRFNVIIPGREQFEVSGPGGGFASFSFDVAERDVARYQVQRCFIPFALETSKCSPWLAVSSSPAPLAPAQMPQHVAFCQFYAKQALAVIEEYHGLKCGRPTGPRWANDVSTHLDWCIGLHGDQGLPKQEAAARRSGLDACKRTIAQKQAPAIPDTLKGKDRVVAVVPAPAPAQPAPHPATCKSGFVWRVAGADDLVCVPPESRARIALENSTAASRIQPGGGAYGPNTCQAGFVWREAFVGDLVCVTPEVRTLVREENKLASSRRVQP